MEQIKSKFEKVQEICNEINDLVFVISDSKIVFFPDISVDVKFNSAEHCFDKLVAWSYVRFIEVSGKNLDFIRKKFDPFNITASKEATDYPKYVHAFRTFLYHNLDMNSQRDIAIRNTCEEWVNSIVGVNIASTDNQWKALDNNFLDGCTEYVNAILSCLKVISKSEHLNIVIDQWVSLISRNFPAHRYHAVVQRVLETLGLLEFFDPQYLTKQYVDKWRIQLEGLPDGFDFEKVSYRIIERFITDAKIIPIDGNDLIALGIPKGPKISQLLTKAREIFTSTPCNKESLLATLKQHF